MTAHNPFLPSTCSGAEGTPTYNSYMNVELRYFGIVSGKCEWRSLVSPVVRGSCFFDPTLGGCTNDASGFFAGTPSVVLRLEKFSGQCYFSAQANAYSLNGSCGYVDEMFHNTWGTGALGTSIDCLDGYSLPNFDAGWPSAWISPA